MHRVLSLLDKVMLHNQWHIGVQESHLMFKDPYGHKKKVCLSLNISIGFHYVEQGQFMLHKS